MNIHLPRPIILPQVRDAEPRPPLRFRTLAFDDLDAEVHAPAGPCGGGGVRCAEDDAFVLLELDPRDSATGDSAVPPRLGDIFVPVVQFGEGLALEAGRVEEGAAGGVCASDEDGAAVGVDGVIADTGGAGCLVFS